MDTDIRKYIKNNLKDSSIEEIEETVISSVTSNDEVVLPGLGVLFEMVWNNINDNDKQKILNTLYKAIKKA